MRLIVSSMVSSSSSGLLQKEPCDLGRRGSAALAGMGFVDNDGKLAPAMLVTDFIKDEGEFLHGGDDNLLAGFDELAQIAGASACPTVALTWANCLIVSRICLSSMRRSVTTMIESKIGCSSFLQPDQLVGQPGDGVALAAAGRVLDQVALAHTAVPAHRQAACAPHPAGGSAGRSVRVSSCRLFVLCLDDLGIIFNDIGQSWRVRISFHR